VLVIPAAPAQASTYGIVDICFQASTTMYGTTYWGIYNRTVRVDAWVDGGPHQILTITPSTRGCVRQALPPATTGASGSTTTRR
jgi:hypothetical protein